MDEWIAILSIASIAAIASSSMLINDALHQRAAYLAYRQYRNSLDEMTRCIDALAAQNGAQLVELDRLRKASDLSEFEAVMLDVDLEARR